MSKKDTSKPGVVYVVWDRIEPGRVRYVGRTVQKLRAREWKHWSDSKKFKTAFSNWLRSREGRSEDVVFEELSWHPNVEELNSAEVEAIRRYREIGQADLNLTDGGDGAVGLEWTQDRRERHFNSVPRGEDHPGSKLTWEVVNSIRKMALEGGVNSRDISDKYEVSISTITEILRNETWYDHTYNPSKWRKCPRSGEGAGNARLTWSAVKEIRELRQREYLTNSQVAEKFGVSKDMIRLILLGKNWEDSEYDPNTITPRKGAK